MVSELKWDPENLEVQNLKIIGKIVVLKRLIYKVNIYEASSLSFGLRGDSRTISCAVSWRVICWPCVVLHFKAEI